MKITITLNKGEEVDVLNGFIETNGSPIALQNLPTMTKEEKITTIVDIFSKQLKQSYISYKLKVPTKDLQNQVSSLADSITIT